VPPPAADGALGAEIDRLNREAQTLVAVGDQLRRLPVGSWTGAAATDFHVRQARLLTTIEQRAALYHRAAEVLAAAEAARADHGDRASWDDAAETAARDLARIRTDLEGFGRVFPDGPPTPGPAPSDPLAAVVLPLPASLPPAAAPPRPEPAAEPPAPPADPPHDAAHVNALIAGLTKAVYYRMPGR
jgi:uncharacterized protein YukE